MSERVTYGFQLEVTNLGTQTEPINTTTVKTQLNIRFSAQDNKIKQKKTANKYK